MGPLEEQPLILTTEPPLQTQTSFHFRKNPHCQAAQMIPMRSSIESRGSNPVVSLSDPPSPTTDFQRCLPGSRMHTPPFLTTETPAWRVLSEVTEPSGDSWILEYQPPVHPLGSSLSPSISPAGAVARQVDKLYPCPVNHEHIYLVI